MNAFGVDDNRVSKALKPDHIKALESVAFGRGSDRLVPVRGGGRAVRSVPDADRQYYAFGRLKAAREGKKVARGDGYKAQGQYHANTARYRLERIGRKAKDRQLP